MIPKSLRGVGEAHIRHQGSNVVENGISVLRIEGIVVDAFVQVVVDCAISDFTESDDFFRARADAIEGIAEL